MHFLEAFHEIGNSSPGIRIGLIWSPVLENYEMKFDALSGRFRSCAFGAHWCALPCKIVFALSHCRFSRNSIGLMCESNCSGLEPDAASGWNGKWVWARPWKKAVIWGIHKNFSKSSSRLLTGHQVSDSLTALVRFKLYSTLCFRRWELNLRRFSVYFSAMMLLLISGCSGEGNPGVIPAGADSKSTHDAIENPAGVQAKPSAKKSANSLPPQPPK